jgi:bacterioferritin
MELCGLSAGFEDVPRSAFMTDKQEDNTTVTRDQLADLLNEDLAREYQAVIAYVVYSQVLKGAQYMSIADQLELHARQ